MAEMVKLYIDGKEVEVPKGTTILEAAQKLGIYIPTLCYHPDLRPTGACGICLSKWKELLHLREHAVHQLQRV